MRRQLLCVGMIAILRAQAPETPIPKFEVASINPHKDDANAPGGLSAQHGTFRSIRTNLEFLIMGAYHVQEFQVVGGPGWMTTEWYDVVAKAEAKDQDKDLMLMLRPLLADRFKLSFHRETKEQLVYELVLAKGGLKMHKSTGDAQYSMRMRTGLMTANATKMSTFAEFLASVVRHPVGDKTGLSDAFDVRLEWTPDGAAEPESRSAPSIFTALQEQLGLKLESRKGPVEVLVIDHAERPGAN